VPFGHPAGSETEPHIKSVTAGEQGDSGRAVAKNEAWGVVAASVTLLLLALLLKRQVCHQGLQEHGLRDRLQAQVRVMWVCT
jgi:hypothetical protein